MVYEESDLSQRIDRFVGIFEKDLQLIDSLQVEKDDDTTRLRKTLYVIFMDALSRVAYPDSPTNRSRYTAFLKHFTNWDATDRVSLPHLARLLQLDGTQKYDALRQFVATRLATWVEGDVIVLNRDAQLDEVRGLWPSVEGKEIPINKLTPNHLTHQALMYSYRNHLVHEARRPGYDFQFAGDDEPNYIWVSDDAITGERGRWCLVYPSLFFRHLCRTALDKLSAHLRSIGADPFDRYDFGDFWLPGLNDED